MKYIVIRITETNPVPIYLRDISSIYTSKSIWVKNRLKAWPYNEQEAISIMRDLYKPNEQLGIIAVDDNFKIQFLVEGDVVEEDKPKDTPAPIKKSKTPWPGPHIPTMLPLSVNMSDRGFSK